MRLPAKIVVPRVKRVHWPVALGYWAIFGMLTVIAAVVGL